MERIAVLKPAMDIGCTSFFFFSSRRRHTRCSRDWSSDVCSSDLNGCKKVVIVNGHGGNEHLLPFFAQAQMASPKDYVVYVLDGERNRPGGPAKKSTGVDYHAGENETSNTLHTHPELTHIDRAGRESGADQKRQNLPDFLYTGIWWYARFPNHYSGDGSVAAKEMGEWNVEGDRKSVV